MDYQAPQTPLGAQTPHAHPAYVAVVTTLVVIVAIGGYLALAYATGWWPFASAPAMEPSPAPSASASPTTTPDPATAGWKTYANTTVGYSIQYPPDMTHQPWAELNPLSVIIDSATEPSIEGSGFSVTIAVRSGNAQQAYQSELENCRTGWRESFNQEGVLSSGPTTVGGRAGWQYACRSEYGADYQITFMPLDSGGYLAIGQGFTNTLHSQIVSTLQFTDSATVGWTNFSSRYFTLSFKVPPGFVVTDAENSIRVSGGPLQEYAIGSDNAFMRLQRYVNAPQSQAEAEYRARNRDVRASIITVDGYEFRRLDGVDIGSYEGESAGRTMLVIFDRSTLYVEERAGLQAEPPYDAIAIAGQILSTMRFSR